MQGLLHLSWVIHLNFDTNYQTNGIAEATAKKNVEFYLQIGWKQSVEYPKGRRQYGRQEKECPRLVVKTKGEKEE